MALSTFYRQAVPGRAATFGTTHWSVVLAAGQNDREKAHEALEQLCGAYWYPLYVKWMKCQSRPESRRGISAKRIGVEGRAAFGPDAALLTIQRTQFVTFGPISFCRN